jgi:ATP-dependent helicase HrpB
LLVLDLGGGRKSGAARVPQIRLALPVSEDELRNQLDHLITHGETVTFDPATWSVRVREETRLGAVTLAQEPRPRRTGPDALPEIKPSAEQGLGSARRAGQCRWRASRPSSGLSCITRCARCLLDAARNLAAALLEGGEAPPFAANARDKACGRRSIGMKRRRSTSNGRHPSRLAVSSAHAIPMIIPPARRSPCARRWLYGSDDHPTFGADRQPLLIELLSPAQRPIALTADLPAFWREGWKDVRKDMRARYPKHDWPEEPWKAREESEPSATLDLGALAEPHAIADIDHEARRRAREAAQTCKRGTLMGHDHRGKLLQIFLVGIARLEDGAEIGTDR